MIRALEHAMLLLPLFAHASIVMGAEASYKNRKQIDVLLAELDSKLGQEQSQVWLTQSPTNGPPWEEGRGLWLFLTSLKKRSEKLVEFDDEYENLLWSSIAKGDLSLLKFMIDYSEIPKCDGFPRVEMHSDSYIREYFVKYRCQHLPKVDAELCKAIEALREIHFTKEHAKLLALQYSDYPIHHPFSGIEIFLSSNEAVIKAYLLALPKHEHNVRFESYMKNEVAIAVHKVCTGLGVKFDDKLFDPFLRLHFAGNVFDKSLITTCWNKATLRKDFMTEFLVHMYNHWPQWIVSNIKDADLTWFLWEHPRVLNDEVNGSEFYHLLKANLPTDPKEFLTNYIPYLAPFGMEKAIFLQRAIEKYGLEELKLAVQRRYVFVEDRIFYLNAISNPTASINWSTVKAMTKGKVIPFMIDWIQGWVPIGCSPQQVTDLLEILRGGRIPRLSIFFAMYPIFVNDCNEDVNE